MVLCADRCVKRCDAYSFVYIIAILSAGAVYIISDAVSGLDVADRCTDLAVAADSCTSVAVLLTAVLVLLLLLIALLVLLYL